MDQPSQEPIRRTRKAPAGIIALALVAVVAAAITGLTCKLNCFYDNFHMVVDKQVYRSGRPTPQRIARWSARYGIKTVIDLEAGDKSDYPKMQELGIAELDIFLPSSRLPPPQKLRALILAIETCAKPVLIHCRAGAERTGVASVIAAMAIGGQNYATARAQLSSRYFHVWHDPRWVEGLTDCYESYCRARSLDTGGWSEFRAWAMTVYGQAEPGPVKSQN